MDKEKLRSEIEYLTQSGHPYLGHVVSYKELISLIDNLEEAKITTKQAWEKIAEGYPDMTPQLEVSE